MNSVTRLLLALTACSLLILVAGCSDRDTATLPEAEGNTEGLVFDDDYAEDVYFQPFWQTHITAVSRDSVHALGGLAQFGARSLKFNVPGPGSSLGLFTGGVITSGGPRDLHNFNALSFWVRTNTNGLVLSELGYGNDNTGNSQFTASLANTPIDGEWQRVVIPVPRPEFLRSERGLFTIAQGPSDQYPNGFDIWIDQIEFVNVGELPLRRVSISTATTPSFVGSSVTIGGAQTIFDISSLGLRRPVAAVGHYARYLDLVSSNPSVGVIDGNVVRLLTPGETQITIAESYEAPQKFGTLTVQSYAPPTSGAPVPTRPAADVISMFSDVYDDVPVEDWYTPDWDFVTTELEDFMVGGNLAKLYKSFSYTGVLFKDPLLDATGMTHLHMDVFLHEGVDFKVGLASFDQALVASEAPPLTFNATTTPAMTPGEWVSLDIPLADFVVPDGELDLSRLGQMLFDSADVDLFLLDNVYFYKQAAE